VAKVEGGMVGWVAFGPCRDEGSPPDCAEVWAIYVAPSSWSSGVGRMLWHRAQARMLEQGFKTVSAWVFTQNARAIRFYRAAGFAADLSSVKEFELGGGQVQEIRYARALE
ncbi:MAG: GNAT family N-acetyltransferase, partial [Betaproteobacteria bacterium]